MAKDRYPRQRRGDDDVHADRRLARRRLGQVLNVNLRSVFLFCKYAVPHMPAGGAIVNISSVHAHETTKNVVPYASSKGGMEAFTRGFSEEIAPKKLRINCVAPGAVDTPMLWNNPNVKSGAENVQGAIGKPEDVAAAVCFLAAAEARFITGTTLIVDGGRLDILLTGGAWPSSCSRPGSKTAIPQSSGRANLPSGRDRQNAALRLLA